MIGLIDIGGTQIKYAWFDPAKQEIVASHKLDTEADNPNFKIEKRLEIVLKHLFKTGSIEGVAISTAGIVNSQEGRIIYANKNLPNYAGTNLKKWIEESYGLPCSVENDVNCALLGEIYFGNYPHLYEHAIMFTIGTGVGGAILINGQIYHGAHHSAGEVGYSILDNQPIEELASTRSIVKNLQEKFSDEQINGYKIFERAKDGHPDYIAAIDELMTNLVVLINNAASLMDPEIVILGGGIMEQTDYLRPILDAKIEEVFTNKLLKATTKVDFARLGNMAGLLGAYKHFELSQKT